MLTIEELDKDLLAAKLESQLLGKDINERHDFETELVSNKGCHGLFPTAQGTHKSDDHFFLNVLFPNLN